MTIQNGANIALKYIAICSGKLDVTSLTETIENNVNLNQIARSWWIIRVTSPSDNHIVRVLDADM